MRLKTGSSSGMTLIEMIMLIMIGSVLVGGIVLFARTAMSVETKMRDRLFALELAQMQMESLINVPFGSLGGRTDTTFYGFKVRQIVSTVSQSNQVQPSGGRTIRMRFEVKRLLLSADYASGDFSKPLVELTTYRQSHVLLDSP